MTNSDDFCVCILDKIKPSTDLKEFQKLLAVERAKAFKDFWEFWCFDKAVFLKRV
jgi:hypothetical protein